jgi:hypothetical protein
MMIDYVAILIKHYSNDKWSLNGNEYSGLVWLSNTPKPSKEELDAYWSVIKADIDANAYKEKRAKEYPPIADYLDGIVKGDQAQIQAYIDACLAVKAKYPKGA